MVYDLTMLKAFYALYEGKIERIRTLLQRPLTLAEKILYAHLYDEKTVRNYKRGEDYVNFRPDRVAMQDATAQMALLQFMNAGRDEAAVPSTVHCDHLIQAIKEQKKISPPPPRRTRKCMISSATSLPVTASVSGNPERVSFIRLCWKTTHFPAV